jgi:hypothetical protein
MNYPFFLNKRNELHVRYLFDLAGEARISVERDLLGRADAQVVL